MITQLYDPAIEICDIAVMYLEEVCTEQAKLEKVVAMRPALEHLGDIGHPLFMRYVNSIRPGCHKLMDRFVSTSIGFEYLLEAQYIEREMEIWLTVSLDQLKVLTIRKRTCYTSSKSRRGFRRHCGHSPAIPSRTIGERLISRHLPS